MKLEKGVIKELVKKEEFVSANLDVLRNRRVNIWSKNNEKIAKVLKFVLSELQKEKFLEYQTNSENQTQEDENMKVLMFAKNKEYFEKLNLPKELFMADKVLSEGDEPLLNYLLSTVIENASNEKFYSIFDDYENKDFLDEETKNDIQNYFDEYVSKATSKRPRVYVLIDDISIFQNSITFELLKKVFNISRINKVFAYYGSNIDNNINKLGELSNADKTLLDTLNQTEIEQWSTYSRYGLGNIQKLDKVEENDFLCIEGDLLRQGQQIGKKPYIVGINEDIVIPKNEFESRFISNLTRSNVYKDDFSLLNTEPRELVDYKYSLQEEFVKYMSNFAEIRKIVVKDFKTLLLDYIEFDNVENYDVLCFVNENYNKIKTEFDYRMCKYVQREDYYKREITIEKCFSLGRNFEVIEYIKVKPDENFIKYNWQISNVMLIKTIVDLWNKQNIEQQITSYHFYKYSNEYRQKYGYTDEWSERDL